LLFDRQDTISTKQSQCREIRRNAISIVSIIVVEVAVVVHIDEVGSGIRRTQQQPNRKQAKINIKNIKIMLT